MGLPMTPRPMNPIRSLMNLSKYVEEAYSKKKTPGILSGCRALALRGR